MKTFKKYYTINTDPEMVYKALTTPITMELWTNAPVIMNTEEGSEFSLFDGNIVGKNVTFETNKKIVQQWYFDGEPEESIVTIKLHAVKSKTSVELIHTNIPDDVYDEMIEGWNSLYFGALIDFFEEG